MEKFDCRMTIIAMIQILMEVRIVGKKSGMTGKAAARIQAHADKSGNNQGFKARAQSSAAKNNK